MAIPLASQLLQSLIDNEDTDVEFDLDNWITDFENGFLDYTKTIPALMPGYWGRGVANRPRIREVNTETDAQSNQGYRIIEFFPDRENQENGYLFIGTPIELRTQVAVFMNMSMLFADRELGTFHGMPDHQFQESRRVAFKPQVSLLFTENPQDAAADYDPISAESSFRLMNETEATMTPAKALVLAQRINTVFGGTTPFQWKKGRELWGYIDPERGYHLQIYSWSETEAKSLIGKVLDVQNHAPNWSEYLKDWAKRDSLINTPLVPPTDLIYGSLRRRPRKLPIGSVRFRKATLKLDGMPNPIQLVDLTGLKSSALIKG